MKGKGKWTHECILTIQVVALPSSFVGSQGFLSSSWWLKWMKPVLLFHRTSGMFIWVAISRKWWDQLEIVGIYSENINLNQLLHSYSIFVLMTALKINQNLIHLACVILFTSPPMFLSVLVQLFHLLPASFCLTFPQQATKLKWVVAFQLVIKMAWWAAAKKKPTEKSFLETC